MARTVDLSVPTQFCNNISDDHETLGALRVHAAEVKMSGRVLQLAVVTTVGVLGGESHSSPRATDSKFAGLYTFGPILEGAAKEKE